MVVAGLPIWIVAIIATVITTIYYFRNRKGVMGNWLVVLLVFAVHFFWFGLGVIVFLIVEIIRANKKKREKAKENPS